MIINNLFRLFFPKYCAACFKPIIGLEDELCVRCENNLIYDPTPAQKELKKALRGRVNIEQSGYLFDFTKKDDVQDILHSIKYQKQKKLAVYLAEKLAVKLGPTFFKKIDGILPVPLHQRKLKMRGFNQSESIARGIKNITSIPVKNGYLLRKKFTESQTNKNRWERWENVKHAFELMNQEAWNSKHILLVDDVFTTGATLEACVKTIQEKVSCKCSILTLAKA